jgi:hypothetical protein
MAASYVSALAREPRGLDHDTIQRKSLCGTHASRVGLPRLQPQHHGAPAPSKKQPFSFAFTHVHTAKNLPNQPKINTTKAWTMHRCTFMHTNALKPAKRFTGQRLWSPRSIGPSTSLLVVFGLLCIFMDVFGNFPVNSSADGDPGVLS